MKEHRQYRHRFHACLWGACLIILLFGTVSSWAAPTDKMNILLIHTGNLSTAGVGCYGNAVVLTPHLNALAQRGIRFERAYAAAPAGLASSVVWATGRRPDSTRIYSDHNTITSIPRQVEGLADILHWKRYYLAHFGLLYPSLIPSRHYRNFHQLGYCPIPPSFTGTNLTPNFDVTALETGVEDANAVSAFEQIERQTRFVSERLRRCARAGQTFFMGVGLEALALPFQAPSAYTDLYAAEDMILSAVTASSDQRVPAPAKRFGTCPVFDATERQQGKVSPLQQQQTLATYYAAATFLDAQVGAILKTLAETQLTERTIVIFFSSHGFHLGEHGLWGSHTSFEEVMRVPLIVYVPGATGNGKVCEGIVELVDLVPTLCDLWMLKSPEALEGLSLRPLLQNPARTWKKAAFQVFDLQAGTGQTVRARTIRTQRYRYTEWGPGGQAGVELYDFDSDPHEQHNLALHRKYRPLRDQLIYALHEGAYVAQPQSPLELDQHWAAPR